MNRSTLLRIGSLYLPILLVLGAVTLQHRIPRQFAASLLSLLWTLPTLLLLQALDINFHWWSFAPSTVALDNMPLELYLGWAVLWGLVPQLLLFRLPILATAALMGSLDLLTMPRLHPILDLHANWLTGEAVAAALVLLPALYLHRLTLHNQHLNLRATLQVATSAMLFLYLIPEIAFALRPHTRGWSPLLSLSRIELQFVLQLVVLIAVPGISAVAEFSNRGRGTPIPYDPPQRLVVSGIYRYCANPMQLFCTLIMFAWAIILRNPWLVAAAAISGIYSAGIAHWDEDRDLAQRFPGDFQHYRAHVPNWSLRWKPYHLRPTAHLYIARTCTQCSRLRRWLEARKPLGLIFVDAESLPHGTIRRLTYDPCDGTPTINGVRALASALEHLNLAYAYLGCFMRLPGIWQSIQLLGDASGFGPRLLQADPQPDHCRI